MLLEVILRHSAPVRMQGHTQTQILELPLVKNVIKGYSQTLSSGSHAGTWEVHFDIRRLKFQNCPL